jgi:hypothetical protein
VVSVSTEALLRPSRVYTRAEVLAKDCPVPEESGVYAWYFTEPPAPTDGCHVHAGLTLQYVGISPTKPPQNGKPPSKQRLRKRVRGHFTGNASGSTLRLTLGCLLAEEIGIELRRVGSGNRLTFADGEQVLSKWMAEHARVCWTSHPSPWLFEEELIGGLSLPLNLQGNRGHPFHAELSKIRDVARVAAREGPLG